MTRPGFWNCLDSRGCASRVGADDWIRTVVTGTIPRAGRLSLVYVADKHGRIVSELSLIRYGPDDFLLMCGAGAEWHDEDLLRSYLPVDSDIQITNITTEWTALVLSGPASREILAAVCDADLSAPWLNHQGAEIAGKQAHLMRVSYVGELGWEIHTRMDDIAPVFEAIWASGQSHGLKLFGMYAMDSLRIEKSYRSWKQDLSTDYTMLEGGLERFVKWDKPAFIGRDALMREQQAGSKQGFVCLTVDAAECDAPYLATVWRGDERVGLVTSGNYGHRVQRSLALAVVNSDCTAAGTTLEVEIFGQRCPARVHEDACVYDATNERLRA